MAPETLEHGLFTEYSDVWSYGVLIWEIFHLGSAFPYSDLSGCEEVIQFLENGGRLGKPPMCPQYVYDTMLECWMLNHLIRPNFSELKTRLKRFDQQNNSSSMFATINFDNVTYLDMTVTSEI